MKHRINIIITCTKRKHFPPSPDLMIRKLKAVDMDKGFVSWVRRLSRSRAEPVAARELYAGDHWSVVKTLESVSSMSGLEANVWVCSAGYGLINLETKVKPYSATLSPNDPDTICKWANSSASESPSKHWWRLQTEWTSGNLPIPRSIKEVAVKYSDSPMLVIASQPYLKAILNDVEAAGKKLDDKELLCIVSAGTGLLPSLDYNLLHCNATLQRDEGGSLNSLNVRIARSILVKLKDEPFRMSSLQATEI
jgi:hypothetical protein